MFKYTAIIIALVAFVLGGFTALSDDRRHRAMDRARNLRKVA